MIYVDKVTDLIYKVQLFDDFVLVRPAGVGLGSELEQLDYPAFRLRFRESNVNEGDIYVTGSQAHESPEPSSRFRPRPRG